jgi:hypothetical protein
VIGGPICDDGLTWWQVRYGTLEGWTAEASADGEYWVEPVATASEGGLLPVDLASGLSFMIGGAGGGAFSMCYGARDGSSSEIYLDGEIGAFSGHLTADGFDFTNYPTGSTLTTFYPYDENIYDKTQDNAFNNAGICTRFVVDPTDVTLIDPDGEVSALLPVVYNFEDVVGSQIVLPLDSYLQPGVWTIMIEDFRLYVRITIPTAPTVMRLEDTVSGDLWDYRIVIMGFPPNMDTAVVMYDDVVSDDALTVTSESTVIVTTTDDNGTSMVIPMPELHVAAIVPANGQDILFLRQLMTDEEFFISAPCDTQLIYDVVWNGIAPTDSEGWTCAGL